jgi:aryl-alcohol dehydrogenase-like predicted oxidoreductase
VSPGEFFQGCPFPVSRVGLGFGLGGVFRRVESPQHFIESLNFAIEQGVNHIDSAQNYAAGQSEELIGAISKAKKQQLLIATKLDTQNYSKNSVPGAVEASLKRLRMDEIPLLYLHWPNPSVPLEETLESVVEMVQLGKVRSVGLSNFSLDQLREAQKFLGGVPLSAVQSEYNLFDRSAENDLIPYCTENSISFVAYSPLDQGRVLGDGVRLAALSSISERLGVTSAQLALAWLLRSSPAFLIPSSSNTQRLKMNSSSLEIEIDDVTAAEVEQLSRFKISEIRASDIKVTLDETGRRDVMTSLEEAKANRFELSPSPTELAQELAEGANLKPVRVRLASDTSSAKKYVLTEGRVRYWAYVIHNGPDCYVPALVRL